MHPEIETRFAALVRGAEDELWARLDSTASTAVGELSSGDCQAMVERISGPQPRFDLAWLEPTSAHDIVVRMLTNLRQRAVATADVALLGWVAHLRAAVPGVGDADLRLLNELRAKLS